MGTINKYIQCNINFYEVAYSVDPECSGDHVSLLDGYTLYYPRTCI